MSWKMLHILSGDVHAGKEVQTLLQLKALKKRGDNNPHLLLFNEGFTADSARAAGVSCTVADEQRGFFHLLFAARRLVGAADPRALLVAHGYKESLVGYLATLGSGRPLVMVLHGMLERHRGRAAVRALLSRALRAGLLFIAARKIVCVSEAMRAALPAGLQRKAVVIRNVVELAAADFSFEREPQLIFLGRLAAIKRPELALRAFAVLAAQGGASELQLLFAGEGPEGEALKTLIAGMGLEGAVRLCGHVANPLELLAASRALLITSESEGLPTVLLEAISVGTPVVSADLPGVREVLQFFPDYPAELISSAEPAAFAQAIGTVLARPLLSAAARAANRETLRVHFSPQAAAAKLCEL